jgi:hypothetical protein
VALFWGVCSDSYLLLSLFEGIVTAVSHWDNIKTNRHFKGSVFLLENLYQPLKKKNRSMRIILKWDLEEISYEDRLLKE